MALDNLKNNEAYEQIPDDIIFTETENILKQYDNVNKKKDKNSTENVDGINGAEMLKKSRSEWKEKISGISDESKKNIIKACRKIPVRLSVENNGNRLIEFQLGDELYKIYDFDLGLNRYQNEFYEFSNVRPDPDSAERFWDGKTMKAISENEKKGFHTTNLNEINGLLEKLGKIANLSDYSDQMGMLMYLTGMNGNYYLGLDGYDGVIGLDYYSRNSSSDYSEIAYKNAKSCIISN